MKGYISLNTFPQLTKDKINAKFGSIDNLYMMVFDLFAFDYYLNLQKPFCYKSQRMNGRKELSKIEYELLTLGISNSSKVILEISNDHFEVVVMKRTKDIYRTLKQYSSDYKPIRSWFKNIHKV